MDALVPDQLPEVDDGRLVVGEERGETPGVALVGKPLLGVPGVRPVGASLRDELRERLGAILRDELVDVDPRRHLDDAVDVADDILEHLADVLRPDVDRLRRGERLPSPTPPAPAGRASSTRARSRAP